jgi:hypothetical protein
LGSFAHGHLIEEHCLCLVVQLMSTFAYFVICHCKINKYVFVVGCFYASAKRQTFSLFFVAFLNQDYFIFFGKHEPSAEPT